jgi:hypothetical protein
MIPNALAARAFRETFRHGPLWGRLGPHLVIATLAMLGLAWMATGTLAPLSATDAPRLAPGGCGYTLGTDNGEWVRVFWMLDGRPVADWASSIYLRRLLYPLLAFPFYKTLGFLVGGLVFNALLYTAMLWAWGRWLLTAVGRRGAVAGVWLLASFPGLAYWGGLPYSTAAILPITVFGLILLDRLDRPDRPAGPVVACAVGLGLGTVSQAYDLIAYLGPAALGLVAWRRRWRDLAPLVAGLVLPFAATAALLWGVFDAPGLSNSNTDLYAIILGAYRDGLTGAIGLGAWAAAAADTPWLLGLNLLDGTNWVLPVATLALVALLGRTAGGRPAPAETALGLVILLVFLFNNLAPPYDGWQMRGAAIARLYQPAAVVLIALAARCVAATVRGESAARRRRVLAGGLVAVAVGAQAVIVADGFLGTGHIANWAWHRFYMDKTPERYLEHRARYGVRPWGYCWKGHPAWPEARPGEV